MPGSETPRGPPPRPSSRRRAASLDTRVFGRHEGPIRDVHLDQIHSHGADEARTIGRKNLDEEAARSRTACLPPPFLDQETAVENGVEPTEDGDHLRVLPNDVERFLDFL